VAVNGDQMARRKQTGRNITSKETTRDPLFREGMHAASTKTVSDQPAVFEEQMEAARRIMKKRRNALRQLAK
jgi:hypothetical protein